MLDLRQLAVLQAVARTGSLAAAARDLYVSQPTVTHHLDALERGLGAQLVERGPRGTHLTDIGQVLLGHSEAVLERLASAESEIRALASQGVATLRVGTFPSAGATLLPRALGATQMETGVRFELREAETPQLIEALAEGSLHAALVYSDLSSGLEVPPGWTRTRLMEDPFLLALPDAHPLAQAPHVRLGELADEGWILARDPGDPVDLALLGAAAVHGFAPRPVLRTDDFQVSFGFVAAGLGIALVPRLALDRPHGVVVRAIEDVRLARGIDLVRREAPPPAVTTLERELLAAARDLDERAGSA